MSAIVTNPSAVDVEVAGELLEALGEDYERAQLVELRMAMGDGPFAIYVAKLRARAVRTDLHRVKSVSPVSPAGKRFRSRAHRNLLALAGGREWKVAEVRRLVLSGRY